MFGILGVGDTPKKVIEAGLNDIGKTKTFVVPWYGGAVPDSLEVIYDWLIDNEVDYDVVHDESGKPVPKALAANARVVCKATNGDIAREVVTLVDASNGTILVLWDGSDEDESVRLASLAINSKGVRNVLELNNGLTPIMFSTDDEDEDEPAPAPAPVVDDEDEFEVEMDAPAPILTPDDIDEVLTIRDVIEDDQHIGAEDDVVFNEDELKAMPAPSIKRIATDRGIDITGKVKATLIQEIVASQWPGSVGVIDGDADMSERASDATGGSSDDYTIDTDELTKLAIRYRLLCEQYNDMYAKMTEVSDEMQRTYVAIENALKLPQPKVNW